MGWELPECFARTAAVAGSAAEQGRHVESMCRCCGLLETFSLEEVDASDRARLCIWERSRFDAVKHLLLCRIEQRPPRLDLENYPHLPLAQVRTTQAVDYMALLASR